MKTKYILITITFLFLLGLFVSSANIEYPAPLIEESIEVEDWMTEPFQHSVEEPIEVEEWMTKPFNI